MAANGTPPKRGSIRELKEASSRARVEGRRSAALPHHSSSHAEKVVRPAVVSVLVRETFSTPSGPALRAAGRPSAY
jgi:hypothetical protein